MANITVSVPTSTITVDTTNSIVNVASTTSNVLVGETVQISNSVVRSAISVTDTGGDGSLVYNSGTGVITYTGVSASETRAHFSATSPVLYNSGTGVISIDSGALFSGKTTDDLPQGSQNIYFSTSGATVNTNSLPEGSTNLYFTDARADARVNAVLPNTDSLTEGSTNLYYTNARSRAALSGANGITYNTGTGVIELTDADFISGVTAGLGLDGGGTTGNVTLNVDAGPGILINASNEVELDTTGLVTIAGAQDITGLKTFDGGLIVDGQTSGTPVTANFDNATIKFRGDGGSFTSNVSTQFNNHDVNIYRGDIRQTMEGTGPGASTYKTNIFDSAGITYYGNINLESRVTYPTNPESNTYVQTDMTRSRTVKTNFLFMGTDGLVSGNVLYGTGANAVMVKPEMTVQSGQLTPRLDLYSANANEWADPGNAAMANATKFGEVVDTFNPQTISGDKTFTDDLTLQGNITGNLNITGDASVNSLDVKDNFVVLTSGNTSQLNTTAGIKVDRSQYITNPGANVALQWLNGSGVWQTTSDGSNYYELVNSAYTGGLTDLTGDVVTTANVDAAIVNTTGNAYIGADLNVSGNLEVTGNINYREVEDLLVRDQTITLNFGNASAQNAQIIVDRAGSGLANTDLKWNETADKWQFTNDGTTYNDILDLARLSVTQASASGTGALVYDNTSGVFTYTPPVLPIGDITDVVAGAGLSGGGSTGAVTLALDTTSSTFVDGVEGVLSVTTGTAVSGGSLAYDNTSGVFTFAPSTGIDLDELSVTTAAAAGGGALAYDNTSGVFTFTPTSIPVTRVNGITGAVVLTTTDIAEGTNEYYTDTRSRAAVSTTTGTAVAGGALTYDNTTGVFTYAPSTAQDSTQIVNGTSNVSIATTDGNITMAVGNAPVVDIGTTGAANPAEFTVQGNITALSNVSAQEFIGNSINSTAGFAINSGNGTTVTSPFGINSTVTETANIAGKGYGVFNSTNTEGILTYSGTSVLEWYILSGSTTAGSTTLTITSIIRGVDNTAATLGDMNVGQVIANGQNVTFPLDAYVVSINAGAGTVTMSQPAIASHAFGTLTGGSFVSGIQYEILSLGDTDWGAIGAPQVVASSGNIVTGTEYIINSTGDTDFTLIGASSNGPDTIFTATGPGSGTGTVIATNFTATGAGSGTGTAAEITQTILDAGMVDTTTGLVIGLYSNLRATGGGSDTLLNQINTLNFPFGYPATGPEPLDFEIYTTGTASDYTIGDYSAYTVGQTPVTNSKTALNAPLGITIGENTQLTNRGENDRFRSFGVNMMWDGTDDSVVSAIQPQILFKQYTDNSQQEPIAGNTGTAGAGPRLFFTSATGNAEQENPYNAYPRQNQELGRMTFWGSTGTQLNPSSYNVPGFISVAAADNWDTWSGVGVGGNTNVYMGATSNGQDPDTYLSYKNGELFLGSNSTKPITLAPAYSGSAANPSLAYEGTPTKWAEVNYATGTAGAKFTVNNGGSVDAGTVGDMQMSLKRNDNSSNLTTNISTIFDGYYVNPGFSGQIWLSFPDVSNSLDGLTATFSAAGTITTSTGNESALGGNSYTLTYKYPSSTPGLSLYNLNNGAVTYSSIGGSDRAFAPQSGGATVTTVVSSGVTAKEWKFNLEEQSEDLKLQSGSTTIVEYTDSITDFSNRVKFKNHTSAEILALTGMTAGEVVYNSTDALVTYFDGTNWRNITQGAIVT